MSEFLPGRKDDVPGYDEIPPPPTLLSPEEIEKARVTAWFEQNPRYKKLPGYAIKVSIDDWPDTVDELFSN